jgi:hypothetical protein
VGAALRAALAMRAERPAHAPHARTHYEVSFDRLRLPGLVLDVRGLHPGR